MKRSFVIRSQSVEQLRQIAQLVDIDPCIAGGFSHTRLHRVGRGQVPAAVRLFSEGEEQICEIAKGFLLSVSEGRMTQDWAVSGRSLSECLRIRILRTGRASFGVRLTAQSSPETSCSYAIQPAGAWMSAYYGGQELLRLINISISRSYLRDGLGVGDEDLPPVLIQHWQKRECYFGTLAMSKTTRRLADGLFNVEAHGRWLQAHLAASGTQLLVAVFGDWLAQEKPVSLPIRLGRRDTTRLYAAAEMIEATAQQPLKLGRLAQEVALNRNKLHYGFRGLYGMSVSEYYTHIRMKRALELLRTSSHSIGTISEMLGYSEHTNFSSVFRKYFGTTPRKFRKESDRQKG